MEKLIAIVGATATGKSSVAIKLAKKINGEIISADSAQVYKGLNIGTAKITAEEGKEVTHHLINIVGPETEYNVGRFQIDATNAITEVSQKGKIPILCGGSGLYINSIIYSGYDLGTTARNPQLRTELLSLEAEKGSGYLYRLLSEKFPQRAQKIHPNDSQRILRALEMPTDISIESAEQKWQSPYDLRIFGLTRDRSLLYKAIEERVDMMFEDGLIDEVKNALDIGYNPKGNAMSALGYKEIIPLINGEYDRDYAIDLLKKNTRHFAKRQLTWFRRDAQIEWLAVDEYKSTDILVENIFTALKQGKFII